MQNSQMFSTTYLTAVSAHTTFTAMQTAATAKIKLVFSEKNSKFRSPWPFLKAHTVASYVLYYKIGMIYPPGCATIRYVVTASGIGFCRVYSAFFRFSAFVSRGLTNLSGLNTKNHVTALGDLPFNKINKVVEQHRVPRALLF